MSGAVAIQDRNTPAQGSPRSKAATVAQGLRRINEGLLRPVQAFEDLNGFAGGLWRRIAYTTDRRHAFSLIADEPELASIVDHDAARARAVALLLERMPAMEALLAVGRGLRGIELQDRDEAQTRLLVALMIDSFPAGRPHDPVSYFENAVFEVDALRLPPVAVAMGTREIVRTKSFMPSIAELLEACRSKAAELKSASKLVDRAIAARRDLEAAAAEVPASVRASA
jgi:hypothetical protein